MKTINIADYIQSQLDNLPSMGFNAKMAAQMAAVMLSDITKDGDAVILRSDVTVAELSSRIERRYCQWEKDQRKRK